MTTAKKNTDEKVQQIPVEQMYLSPDETRKTLDQAALKELAASIVLKGVLEALIVRPLRAVAVELEDGSTIDYPPQSREKSSELLRRTDVVRADVDDTFYEIVAGQRRWAASKIAGKTTCPCVVREMTDAEASEQRFISNAQREDLPPLEEALALKTLLGVPGATVETVAAKLAKSPSYVGRRLKLLDAIEPVREALKNGAIEVGHALELARLDRKQQIGLLSKLNCGYIAGSSETNVFVEDEFDEDGENEEDERGVCKFCECTPDDPCDIDGAPCSWANDEETVCGNPDCLAQWKAETGKSIWSPTPLSVAQLRSEIARTTLKVLTNAPFPLDDELPPVACTECPKRSGNATLLFEDCAQDMCTDRACFDAKVKVWVKAELETADSEKRKLVMLADKYSGVQGAVLKWNVRVIPDENPIVPCESQEDAIWINGERMGHRTMICRDAKCKTHGTGAGAGSRTVSSRSVKSEDPAKAKAERKKLLDKVNAEKKYRVALFKAVATAPIPITCARDLTLEVCLYALGRAPGQYSKQTAEALGWPEKLFSWSGSKELREMLRKLAPVDGLRVALVAAHSGELAVNEYSSTSKPDDLEKLAALLGLDLKKIRAGGNGSSEVVPAKAIAEKSAKKPAAKPTKKKPLLSVAARKRIADAQKKRWATNAKKGKGK